MADEAGLRDIFVKPPFVTPNLTGPNGHRYLYTMLAGLDSLLEKHNEAMVSRFPGRADPSFIPYQANDRQLVQGPAETNAQFILRMKSFLDAWRIAGSKRAVLDQVHAYLTNTQPGADGNWPECLIVGGNTDVSSWDVMSALTPQSGPPAHRVIDPANWDWDGKLQPWRSWLILFMQLLPTGQASDSPVVSSVGGSGVPGVTSGFATITNLSGITSANVMQYLTIAGMATPANNGTFQIVAIVNSATVIVANPAAVATDTGATWEIGYYPFIGPAPVWGSPSAVWGSFTWGVSCSPDVITSIRQIVQRWKGAGTYYPNIIISFQSGNGAAGQDFAVGSAQGAGNPDGTWGGIGKLVDGVWVPAKTPQNLATAFCDGTGRAIRCYEKNQT